MEQTEYINKRIKEAEKAIKQLWEDGTIKRLSEQEKVEISLFYDKKSLQRLETARIILRASQENRSYSDYSEVVSATYYSMYYIVHAFLAKEYKLKAKEGTYGMHAITINLILYYLVKTNRIASQLYEEYCQTLNTASGINNLDVKGYQQEAYKYLEKYQQQKEARKKFTYSASKNAEEYHALVSLRTAELFVQTLRKMMLP